MQVKYFKKREEAVAQSHYLYTICRISWRGIISRRSKAALQAVYNDLNHGQRKKLLRNPAIRAMFDRYGVVKIEE